MASFKVMHSSSSANSDPSRRIPSSSTRPQQFRRDPNARIIGGYDGYSPGTMTVEGILHETFASDPPAAESSLLMDAAAAPPTPMEVGAVTDVGGGERDTRGKSVDEVWREIVSGEGKGMKEEEETTQQHDEMMTLEDFLAKATGGEDGNAGGESDDVDVKIPRESYGFDHHNPFQMIDKVEGSIVAFGNGVDVYGGGGARGKRARVMMEPLDKAAAQRQRRMIKNRESAARSRERKQAYQVELETLAAKLEEENEKLSVEIEEKRKERYQKLMEFVIPVVEKPKQQPRLFLRRIRSLEW